MIAVRALIRPAEVSDAAAIASCQTACWREAYAGLVPEDYLGSVAIEQRRFERWQARLAGERAVLVAEVGGQVVGVASAGPSRDDPLVWGPGPAEELMSWYVRAAWHGTGLADQLLAVAVGDRPASLWVFAANARAQAFYRRHGFWPDGNRTVDPDTGLEEIRMVRR